MKEIGYLFFRFSSRISEFVRYCRQIYRRALLIICCMVLFPFFPGNAYSVNFSINPVRIFLDGDNKTNVLKIKNQSDDDVSLQLASYAWTHDNVGKNIYTPTRDIIFFPKILTIHKHEEKIIRIGTTIPQGRQEKTYRLFINEIPTPGPVKSTVVQMVLKVGVPVFITPTVTEEQGSIASMELRGGNLYLRIKNGGNVHFIINSIAVQGNDASGKEIYKTEFGGWYLHGGKTKDYTVEIPEEHCHTIKTLRVDVSTDNDFSFREELNVIKEMCTP